MRAAARLLPALVIAAGLALAPSASAKTVWLCKPGPRDDACDVSLRTTRLSPTGDVLGTDDVRHVRRPRFDCFYVYPTVSDQQTPQATLRIAPSSARSRSTRRRGTRATAACTRRCTGRSRCRD